MAFTFICGSRDYRSWGGEFDISWCLSEIQYCFNVFLWYCGNYCVWPWLPSKISQNLGSTLLPLKWIPMGTHCLVSQCSPHMASLLLIPKPFCPGDFMYAHFLSFPLALQQESNSRPGRRLREGEFLTHNHEGPEFESPARMWKARWPYVPITSVLWRRHGSSTEACWPPS